jgi:hypothetical protein
MQATEIAAGDWRMNLHQISRRVVDCCTTMATQQRLASCRLDEELITAMKALQDRDGVPQSEQVRRALMAWLQDRGVLATPVPVRKTARKRAATRKGA